MKWDSVEKRTNLVGNHVQLDTIAYQIFSIAQPYKYAVIQEQVSEWGAFYVPTNTV